GAAGASACGAGAVSCAGAAGASCACTLTAVNARPAKTIATIVRRLSADPTPNPVMKRLPCPPGNPNCNATYSSVQTRHRNPLQCSLHERREHLIGDEHARTRQAKTSGL